MKKLLKTITRVTPGKAYRKIRMETLKPGDLFFFESNGELDVHPDGKFVVEALSYPIKAKPPLYCYIEVKAKY